MCSESKSNVHDLFDKPRSAVPCPCRPVRESGRRMSWSISQSMGMEVWGVDDVFMLQHDSRAVSRGRGAAVAASTTPRLSARRPSSAYLPTIACAHPILIHGGQRRCHSRRRGQRQALPSCTRERAREASRRFIFPRPGPTLLLSLPNPPRPTSQSNPFPPIHTHSIAKPTQKKPVSSAPLAGVACRCLLLRRRGCLSLKASRAIGARPLLAKKPAS
jgi:hypothetical protein